MHVLGCQHHPAMQVFILFQKVQLSHCYKFMFITNLLTLLSADMCDGFSYLTCKTLVFYQSYMSRISEADRIRHMTDSKAARLAREARLMLSISEMITDA